MPVGHLRLRHALFGGVTAAVIWEVIRHILVWFFTTLSKASVVYGRWRQPWWRCSVWNSRQRWFSLALR
jgi:hypothetical protein